MREHKKQATLYSSILDLNCMNVNDACNARFMNIAFDMCALYAKNCNQCFCTEMCIYIPCIEIMQTQSARYCVRALRVICLSPVHKPGHYNGKCFWQARYRVAQGNEAFKQATISNHEKDGGRRDRKRNTWHACQHQSVSIWRWIRRACLFTPAS